MSANNQLVVAPFPEDLEKYAVWHDGCVDNPFDYGQKPYAVVDTLDEAIKAANKLSDEVQIVEYGMTVIRREDVVRYEPRVWEDFPDYKYLAPVRVKYTSSERH